jgi:hypothetical protein
MQLIYFIFNIFNFTYLNILFKHVLKMKKNDVLENLNKMAFQN